MALLVICAIHGVVRYTPPLIEACRRLLVLDAEGRRRLVYGDCDERGYGYVRRVTDGIPRDRGRPRVRSIDESYPSDVVLPEDDWNRESRVVIGIGFREDAFRARLLANDGPSLHGVLGALMLLAAARCATTAPSIRIGHVDPLLALMLGLVALAGTLLVLAQPVHAWDGVAIWYRKTRALLEWQPLSAITFPAYPELGPMGGRCSSPSPERSPSRSGDCRSSFLYLAWLTSLTLWLSLPAPLRIRLLSILAVAAYVDFDAITNGYQDAVVMSVAGLSTVLLGRGLLDDAGRLRAGDDRCFAALGLFFAGSLGFIKAEGVFLGTLLVGGWAIAVATARGPRRLMRLLPFVALWLALVLAWPLLLMANGVSFSNFQGGGAYWLFPLAEIFQRLSRLPLIVHGFARLGPWYVMPIVAAVLMSHAAWRRVPAVRPVVAWLWGCALAHWT